MWPKTLFNYNSIIKSNYKQINHFITWQKIMMGSFSSTNIATATAAAASSIATGINNFNFTEEENKKILEIINNKSTEDLISYRLSKDRAKKLHEWKMENGSFKNVQEILQLNGFGEKVLKKFCQNILDNKSIVAVSAEAQKEQLKKTRFGQFTIPIVPEDFLEICKSCVAIHIGVSSVTWSRFEIHRTMPCMLTHWEHHDIDEKKMHLNDLIQRCLYLDRLIPEGDCYVLESPQTAQPSSSGNAEQININMQKAQIIAILSFAFSKRAMSPSSSSSLSEDCSTDDIDQMNRLIQPNVFYLRRFLTSRLFRTLVGSERISSEEAVMNLLRTHFNLNDILDDDGAGGAGGGGGADESSAQANIKNSYPAVTGEVNVSSELRKIYNYSEGYRKDFLGQALLIGLTFIRLCLLKCPKSLSVIYKNQQQKTK